MIYIIINDNDIVYVCPILASPWPSPLSVKCSTSSENIYENKLYLKRGKNISMTIK